MTAKDLWENVSKSLIGKIVYKLYNLLPMDIQCSLRQLVFGVYSSGLRFFFSFLEIGDTDLYEVLKQRAKSDLSKFIQISCEYCVLPIKFPS